MSDLLRLRKHPGVSRYERDLREMKGIQVND